MEFKDPASYTDLAQGKIKHILFRISVDFSTRTLEIEVYLSNAGARSRLPVFGFLQDRSKRSPHEWP